MSSFYLYGYLYIVPWVKLVTYSVNTSHTYVHHSFVLQIGGGDARTSEANGRNSSKMLFFKRKLGTDDLGILTVKKVLLLNLNYKDFSHNIRRTSENEERRLSESSLFYRGKNYFHSGVSPHFRAFVVYSAFRRIITTIRYRTKNLKRSAQGLVF